MKSLTINNGIEKIGADSIYYSEYDMIVAAINHAPHGIDVVENFKRQKLLTLLEPASILSMADKKPEMLNESLAGRSVDIELEDADYKKIKELVRVCKYNTPMKALITLANKFDINE